MDRLKQNYYAHNSQITRSMQLRRYFAFIDAFAGLLPPTPCDSSQVGLYITWLSKSLCYSSITNYLSALNLFLKSEGQAPIDYTSHTVRIVLGGAKRLLGCARKQASPILPGQLLKMFAYMSDSLGHIAIRAALITGFINKRRL